MHAVVSAVNYGIRTHGRQNYVVPGIPSAQVVP